MGSSTTAAAKDARPEFLAIFRTHADADGAMSFARFMELALYHPQVGYYRRDGPRVGRSAGTDFFTASSLGPIFGELVGAACVELLGGRNPREFTFVEIGAEPGGGVFEGVAHRFGATRTVRVGEAIALSGKCVVFSNELFDAQPCRRFVFRGGAWRELGVALRGDTLGEIELAVETPPVLPAVAPEGYVMDLPLAAAAFAARIAAEPWSGLFVAFDYGKSWRELAEATPAGTVRAYFRHTVSNDLLARPGEQDLTCHVCWDWLAEALAQRRFGTPAMEAQEVFFVRHAGAFIAALANAEAARFSSRKQALAQLLHPAHMGRKFQILHALRS